jgi:hypothetical protein
LENLSSFTAENFSKFQAFTRGANVATGEIKAMADTISHGLLFAGSDTPAHPMGLGVVRRKRHASLSDGAGRCSLSMNQAPTFCLTHHEIMVK